LLDKALKILFMKLNSTLTALLVLITFSSCHRYYTSSSFEEKTLKHKSVAILPPQMILSGNQPKNLTQDQIAELEEKESKLFQEALYNNILRRANQGKYSMDVMVQPYSNTIALLEKNSVSIRETWTKDDKELAEMLGVDAIVRSSIQKERYMSDLASAGIDAGKQIIDAVLKKPVLVPGVINKTSDIRATCSIISKGETLWNDSYKRESDWNSPANEIIENITDNFARHFPYRKKA
jgi:hypothetical protein